jgi:hypothetical protein
MLKRNRKKIILAGIVLFLAILYFKPFSRTEIIILYHMTEMESDGTVAQICLVKNPPYYSSTLTAEIEAFNKSHPVKGKYYRRLFIKEHDKVWFSGYFLQENVDYESKNMTRNDLDNIDFLADSYFTLTMTGGTSIETEVYTGELWYYKY